MEAPVDASLCVTRVLDLAPSEAEAALASCEESLTTARTERRGRILVALAGGTAQLHPAPLSGSSKGFRRRLVGVLRSPHRCFSVPIEIEVGPGSPPIRGIASDPPPAELRICPIGATCLRRPSHYRLFARLAPVLAERVAVELHGAAAVEVPCA